MGEIRAVAGDGAQRGRGEGKTYPLNSSGNRLLWPVSDRPSWLGQETGHSK